MAPLSCLISLARTFMLMLKKLHEWTFLSCSWFYGENFQSFNIKYDSCGFLHRWSLLHWGNSFLSGLLSIFFLSSRVLSFHHFFILLDSHIALSFILLIWYTYIKWFSVVKLTLHLWEKSKLVLMYDPFLPYLIRVASVLLRFYVCMSVYVCVCLCSYFLMLSLCVKTQ